MTAAFLPIALSAYIVGVFLTGLSTIYRSETSRGGASAVFVVAWLAHTGAVIQEWVATGGAPLTNLPQYLLMLGWAVMTLHLLVWFGWRVHVAGLLLPPMAALTAFAALALLPRETLAHPVAARGWFLFHVAVSTVGMATLCVALAMSLIYLFQDRALKSHRTLRLLSRLPTLDKCDQIGFHALLLGFVLLTAGILTGVVVNAEMYHRVWVIGLKQNLTMLAWLVFAAVLVARLRLGFRGRMSAYLTITGVTLGLLTVVGMTL